MNDLHGHTALITGGSSGVGRAIAEAFARAGAGLVLHGRESAEDAEPALAACRAHGADPAYLQADLDQPTDRVVADLVARATAARPELDILVNNAGGVEDGPFEDMSLEVFERTMRVNVTTGYFLTQALSRRWEAAGTEGRVLFTGSINGMLAEPTSTAYDISKGAVEMMVKTLCVALAPKGIRVNGVSPGLVRSGATAWLGDHPTIERWIAHHTPNGRIPDAAVCGPAAVYLVSDDAPHTHGHMLRVDGGMSAWQHPNP